MRTTSQPYLFTKPALSHGSTLTFFTCVLAFIVILLGAYTRLTNAGLSCPDWPHCYGFITAPHTNAQIHDAAIRYPATPVDVKKAWTEMTHRYFAGTEGILILLLAFTTCFSRNNHHLKTHRMGVGLIALLSIQVLLGMLTVTEKLKPLIVLSHLITGISILSVLWWLYLTITWNRRRNYFYGNAAYFKSMIWAGFFLLTLQITLGGWVSTHYAGLACIDFPYCNGVILPPLTLDLNSNLITIHMLHRIGALITAVYFVFLAANLFRQTHFRALGCLLFLFLCIQLTLGILNIIWLRPVAIAMLHQATAILLLLTIIAALVKIYNESRDVYARRIA